MSDKYKVVFYQGSTYEVIKKGSESVSEILRINYPEEYCDKSVFQGSLSDCEAYIRLKESGYM